MLSLLTSFPHLLYLPSSSLLVFLALALPDTFVLVPSQPCFQTHSLQSLGPSPHGLDSKPWSGAHWSPGPQPLPLQSCSPVYMVIFLKYKPDCITPRLETIATLLACSMTRLSPSATLGGEGVLMRFLKGRNVHEGKGTRAPAKTGGGRALVATAHWDRLDSFHKPQPPGLRNPPRVGQTECL